MSIKFKTINEKELNKLTFKSINSIDSKELKQNELLSNYMYFSNEIKMILIFHCFYKNEKYRNWIFDNVFEFSNHKESKEDKAQIIYVISQLCEKNINKTIGDENFKTELIKLTSIL